MIGSSRSLGQFAMKGPFLARQEDEKIVRFVALPADTVCDEDNTEEGTVYTLQPARGEGAAFQANWQGNNTLSPLCSLDIKTPENPPTASWVSDKGLQNYFRRGRAGFLRSSELFQRESRFGIAMNYATGRPEDQMIYQAEFVRPETIDSVVGLLVQVDDAIPWTTIAGHEGIMGFGGEGHSARYRVLSDEQVIAHAGQQCTYERIKLVLLTPAWFSGGWQPANGDAGWSDLLCHDIKLVAAAVQRPQHIGGWDMAHNWHKPMVACVPPGSVFFFESKHPISFTDNVLTETPDGHLPFDKQGFGQVAAGTWEWLDIS